MSRAITFAKAGGPEVLEFVNKEVAAPGPAEVRIKVKAIGLNRAESMWRPNRTAATARGAERHVEVQVGAGAEGLRIAAAVSRVTAAAADRRWLGGTAGVILAKITDTDASFTPLLSADNAPGFNSRNNCRR
jgi:NADPH:quinone reductase-like Zn-dependent oxidoreductase